MVYSVHYTDEAGRECARTFHSDSKRRVRWLAKKVLGKIAVNRIEEIEIKRP